jgi:hypothetical protein
MSLDIYLTPTACKVCGLAPEGYSANITHNLGKMAEVAGIYVALWHPADFQPIPIRLARDLIVPLELGIKAMESDPGKFQAHNSTNGWGTYKDFLPWLKKLLAACYRLPDAEVSVSI